MKYIIIVPDGMADEPVPELNGQTPLEVARTTNMDYLVQNGSTGLVQTIPDGMHPGSDIGNMALMGYAPERYHTGRSPLEAANMNIMLMDDEIAFRCNLITEQNGIMADYSAGHVSTKEASILIDALNSELSTDFIKFYTGKSYRHILVLKVNDPALYKKIKTVAPHDILGQKLKNHFPKGHDAELLLNLMEKSKVIFENHHINTVRSDLGENPATMIWLWGQGTRPELPSFKEKFGVKGSIISAVDLVNGIGRLANLDIIDVPGITGYYDTNYQGKADYALKSLKEKDFVYIHIESPDEAGHNGDIQEKIKAIENIDKHIVGTVLNYFEKHDDVRILVLPDHPTPVKLRTHTNDPVCFAMYGKGIAQDGASALSEKIAQEQGLKFSSGEDLIEHFMKKYL